MPVSYKTNDRHGHTEETVGNQKKKKEEIVKARGENKNKEQ